MADDTGGPSRTALGVAMLRAFHQKYDASPKILDDPIVARLLPPQALDRLGADRARYQTPGAVALRAHVLLRSRYAEDRLQAAAGRGLRQYVLLGAGLDTFAYRQPEWARGLRIFEVDQPASQADKRRRLETAGIQPPAQVEYVPIDFETTSIADGLRASRFDPSRPAFLSWLGVMVYLSRSAAEAVFAFVASLPPASELVFTFSQHDERPAPADGSRLAARVSRVGEPFKTRIALGELVSHLSSLGFSSVTIPSREELDAWYTHDRRDGLRPGPRQTIASAVV